jgi:DNA-binding NtrC family response regulator
VHAKAAPNDTAPAGASGTVPATALAPEDRAKIRIAVIDDERELAESCATVLRLDGYDVTVWDRGQEALDVLTRRAFDIVLTDLFLPQVDGLAILKAALATNPGCLVVVMTGQPSVDSSFEALRQGAWDYLPKPFSAAHLQILISRAAQAILVARETDALQKSPQKDGDDSAAALLGRSPVFRSALEMARKVAPTDAAVFITGESGSGKELVAQFIHRHSRRASRRFVAINCAAMPEALLESEMFGHRKGAFTGAVRDKPGLLETADGGTLFLDELGEMPKSIQAKLLRVIQDGVVRRVGSETPDAVVNVRFISATNRDPETITSAGDLREDLYYRLRVVPIHLPPLRERVEDIPVLADYFLTTAWTRHHPGNTRRPELGESALRALAERPWRGNVRELQNVIEHVAVLADPGRRLEADDLRLPSLTEVPVTANPASLLSTLQEETYHRARDRVIAQFETQYFTWLINRAGGNMSQAARLAGVDRTTLYRLMERHHLHRDRGQGWTPESTPDIAPAPAREPPVPQVELTT